VDRARVRALLAALTAIVVLGSACSNPPPVIEPLDERVETIVGEQLRLAPVFEKIRAVVVTRGGETLSETYQESSPEDYHVVFSVTKSIISTLIGIAIEDGLIVGVDAPLGDVLPGYRDQMTGPVATTTLKQLLAMTAGFTAPEDADNLDFMRSPDPVAHILTHPYEQRRLRFAYSNEASHLLAAVLVEATGMSVLDYARQALFDPIGISTEPADEPVATSEAAVITEYQEANGFGWPVDPQGVHLGWGGVKLRTADMTALGQLYLEKGVWGGKHVVPANWVADATSPQVATGSEPESYGYQWWVGESDGHPMFRAQGFGGQFIHVVPELDLVIVITTEVDSTDITDYGVGLSTLAFIVELIVEEVDT
jgi:CubicO group peptidase (beta-lactamase class C family)